MAKQAGDTQKIIRFYTDGMIGEDEMHCRLDAIKVRGCWEDGIYTGYDYDRQHWVRFDHTGEWLAA